MEKNNGFKKIIISIKNLSLWDENARFPDKYFNKPEEELIKYFLSKKDFKIKEFTEAIVNDFDLPQIESIVVHKNNDRFIALEGNRRITVYKLLNNPNLIDDAEFKIFFEEQKSRINIDDNFTLESLVTEDIEQGLRYIDRKHAMGNNEINWRDTERAYYSERRGNAKKNELFKIAITKIINKLDIPESLKEQVLGSGYVTTLFRITNSTPAWDLYGFELDNGGNLKIKDRDFNEKLKVIIFNVLKKEDFGGKKIDSRSLNKNSEIQEYLQPINNGDFKKVKEEIEKEEIKINSAAAIIPKKSEQKISTDRKTLIPRKLKINISHKRINLIYDELKKINVNEFRNAVSVLFRVFLELSCDCFITNKKLPNVNILELKLFQKLEIISKFMESRGILTKNELKPVRTSLSNKDSIFSSNTFNSYVHNSNHIPLSDDLKISWDNMEKFIEQLWK